MTHMISSRCTGCGQSFSSYAEHRVAYCADCRAAVEIRLLFGEGEAADRWIAMLHPHVLVQEQHCQAYRGRLVDAYNEAVQLLGVQPHDFTDA